MKTSTCLTFSLKPLTELMNSAERSTACSHTVLNIMAPGHKDIRNAIDLAWDVFDHYRSQTLSLPTKELEKFNTVIHKLNCVSKQLQTIEFKICDPLLKIIPQGPLSQNALETLQTAKENIQHLLDRTHPNHRRTDSNLSFALKNTCSHIINTFSFNELDAFSSQLHKLIPAYCELRKAEAEAYEQIFNKQSPKALPPPSNIKNQDNTEMDAFIDSLTKSINEMVGEEATKKREQKFAILNNLGLIEKVSFPPRNSNLNKNSTYTSTYSPNADTTNLSENPIDHNNLLPHSLSIDSPTALPKPPSRKWLKKMKALEKKHQRKKLRQERHRKKLLQQASLDSPAPTILSPETSIV